MILRRLFIVTEDRRHTVYPKKYAYGFCFAVLCCGYTLTDFPISIRLTSLALWQSNDCPSASKATLMNMDKYFMWIHYERLNNHNKAKHNKTVCIFICIHRIGNGITIDEIFIIGSIRSCRNDTGAVSDETTVAFQQWWKRIIMTTGLLPKPWCWQLSFLAQTLWAGEIRLL